MSSLAVSSGGGTVIDGALQLCPGTTVSLTCSHDSTRLCHAIIMPGSAGTRQAIIIDNAMVMTITRSEW